MTACLNASHPTLALLLEHGAAPDATDHEGSTGLRFLAEYCSSGDPAAIVNCMHELWLHGAPMALGGPEGFSGDTAMGTLLEDPILSVPLIAQLLAMGCCPLPAAMREGAFFTATSAAAAKHARSLSEDNTKLVRAELETSLRAAAPGGCLFARLAVLRSREFFPPGARWWTMDADYRAPRFCNVLLERASRAALLLRETAEAGAVEAATRALLALQQWRTAAAAAAPVANRLAYAAAMCVAKWHDIAGALSSARPADVWRRRRTEGRRCPAAGGEYSA